MSEREFVGTWQLYELTGHRLTLRTPPLMIGGAEAVGYLVWEHIE